MSTRDTKPGGSIHSSSTEPCKACGRETPHSVHIELVTESRKRNGNEKFSREPYRIATCMMCGQRERLRMNNA